MVKGVKKVETVKGDYVTIRVLMPKSTYRALRVKSAMMDMTVRNCIVDTLNRSVKGVKMDIENINIKV